LLTLLGFARLALEAEGRSGRLIDKKYRTGFRRDRREAVFSVCVIVASQ
jgi:hypothetical protein